MIKRSDKKATLVITLETRERLKSYSKSMTDTYEIVLNRLMDSYDKHHKK